MGIPFHTITAAGAAAGLMTAGNPNSTTVQGPRAYGYKEGALVNDTHPLIELWVEAGWAVRSDAVVAPEPTVPTVVSTDPADEGAIAANGSFSVTFSEAMDPLTMTNANIKVFSVNDEGFVASSEPVMSVGDTVATLAAGMTPYNSSSSNHLKITVTTDVESALGVPLAEQYQQVTGMLVLAVPTVVATEPVDGGQVADNGAVKITFSIAMDPATLIAANLKIMKVSDETFLTVVVSAIVGGDTQVFFDPVGNFALSTDYKLIATTGCLSADGVPLAEDFVQAGVFTAFQD